MKNIPRNKVKDFDSVNVELDRIRDLLSKIPIEVGDYDDPNGNVSANLGTLYSCSKGGSTSLWTKQSGGTDKTGWVATSGLATKEFGHYGISIDQTTGISAGDPLKFDTCFLGNIAFNPATYTWTLKAGKTYRLTASSLVQFTAAAGYIYLVWKTVAGTEIGYPNVIVGSTYASNVGTQNAEECLFTATVDTSMRFVIKTVSNLTLFYGGYNYAIIQEI